MSPIVSVIIPTKNSARTLEICLLSLSHQTYKDYEVIVVDNFSSDGTEKIARKYTDNVHSVGPERTVQKNYGIEKAKGKYVVFIDSDMELTPTVLEEVVSLFIADKTIGGICIPEDSVGEGVFVSVRDYERSFYSGSAVESARCFSTLDVRKVGGFEEGLIFFEESLLPQKISAMLHKDVHARIKSLIHHHEGDIRLGGWLAKKYYYGKSLSLYKERSKEIGIDTTASAQTNIFERYFTFLRQKRFYKKPILALGVLSLKTLEFGSGALGLISSKIFKS